MFLTLMSTEFRLNFVAFLRFRSLVSFDETLFEIVINHNQLRHFHCCIELLLPKTKENIKQKNSCSTFKETWNYL